MSKTQLQTNNTRLASLIDTLKGKAAGGGGASVETCTVTVNSFTPMISYVFNVYENGSVKFITANAFTMPNEQSVTVHNVICGSIVYIDNEYFMNGYTLNGGITLNWEHAGRMAFVAPTVADAICTVDIYDND